MQAQKEGYLIPKTYSLPRSTPGDTVSGIDFTATGNAGVIKGKALSGGAGVTGARVEAVNQANQEAFPALTDGDGAYALSLPGGTTASRPPRKASPWTRPSPCSLPPGGTVLDAHLRLIPDQGSIAGTVASGNAALGGCELAYRHAANAGLSGSTVTDPAGPLFPVPAGRGGVYPSRPPAPDTRWPRRPPRSCPGAGPWPWTSTSSRAGAVLKGKVVGVSGSLSGVKITAARDGEAVSTLTDFNGAFQLALGSGTYALTFSKSGFRTAGASMVLSPGRQCPARGYSGLRPGAPLRAGPRGRRAGAWGPGRLGGPHPRCRRRGIPGRRGRSLLPRQPAGGKLQPHRLRRRACATARLPP